MKTILKHEQIKNKYGSYLVHINLFKTNQNNSNLTVIKGSNKSR